MVKEMNPNQTFDPAYRIPYASYGGSAELPKFIALGNAPKEIESEFWGPMSKIIPLSNFTHEDNELNAFHLKRIKLFTYSRLSRKELSNYDERLFENLEIVFRGAVSLGTNGLLLERSSENRQVVQSESSEQKMSLKDFLVGKKENRTQGAF
jgi:hypothetical protein